MTSSGRNGNSNLGPIKAYGAFFLTQKDHYPKGPLCTAQEMHKLIRRLGHEMKVWLDPRREKFTKDSEEERNPRILLFYVAVAILIIVMILFTIFLL